MRTPSPIFVRLAGFLAERGVQQVEIAWAGETQTLPVRATNLPGVLDELSDRGPTLRVPALGLEITLQADREHLEWTCCDTRLTIELARAIGGHP